jgi:hypothetical protein
MSGAFNLQTGLVANNGQIPAIGSIVAGSGTGGSGATVNGIVSRQGNNSTDLKVIIGAGLNYFPAGTAGGTLSSTAVASANCIGIRSSNGSGTTDVPALYTNGVSYSGGAGGLVDINSAITAGMTSQASTTGEQFFTDINGLQLRTTNTPASLGANCILQYNFATTNYTWVLESVPAPVSSTFIGMIVSYGLATATFPITAPDGSVWHLCNGLNTTPDLTDQFVRGTATPALVATAIPGATDTNILTVAQLPSHTHSIASENMTVVIQPLDILEHQSTAPNQTHAVGDYRNCDHLHDEHTGTGYIWTGVTAPSFSLSTVGGTIACTGSNVCGAIHNGTTPAQSELANHKHAIPQTSTVQASSSATSTVIITGATGSGTAVNNIPIGVYLYYIMRTS